MSKKNSKNQNNAVNTFVRQTAFAALGCSVILITPPKSADPDKAYWAVKVANDTTQYSPTYRLKSEATAYELAVKIAEDRGLQVITKAAPERPVIHPPAQQA